ncbi:MFS transporter [Actinomadura terrae]|uniref:MFS transporter n=1 Tax=Actinomadura terrae TaxID=604353 RepID=UPI001FA7D6D1|nr:MFS transporter [Actinomadura terrae]
MAWTSRGSGRKDVTGSAEAAGVSPRLGRHFARLWTASTLSGLGDGITQVAAALLAASLTRDPVQIAGITVAQQLPLMLFALPSGVLVDRLDRRRVMVAACLVRATALGLPATATAAGHASLPLLYASFFTVGCVSLLFENASVALLPSIIDASQLQRANGRLQAAAVLSQQLLAKPLGGVLFVLAAWAPFTLDTLALLAAAVLITALPVRAPRGATAAPHPTFRDAIGQGLAWLGHHRLLRTMSVTVGLSNLGLGAVFSIAVLIARERLGVGPVGYGLLLTAGAVGGVIGGLTAGRITALFGTGTTLRIGLVIEMLVHLSLALTRDAITAGALFALLSMHLIVFSTIGASLRQHIVPADLLGRVHSAYRLVTNSGMFLGSILGGVLAHHFDLTAPFWLALACTATLTACAWRTLSNHTIQTAREASSSVPKASK